MRRQTQLRDRLRTPKPLEVDDGFRALIERRLHEQQRSVRQHRIVAALALAGCAALGVILLSYPAPGAAPAQAAGRPQRLTAPSVGHRGRSNGPESLPADPSQTPSPSDSSLGDGAQTTLLAGDQAETKSFADGSVLTLHAHAQLTTTGISARRVSARLDAGEVVFDLEPGIDRRWDLDAEVVQLQAADARFAMERTSQEVRVRVMRGAVLVYAASLPRGQVRMTEGQTMHFAVEPEASIDTRLTHRDAAPSKRKPNVSTAPRPLSPPATPVAGPAVSRTESATVADLLLESADWARQSHDVDGAIEILTRFVDRYPGDRRVGVAAFTLGKLTLHKAPARAAEWFQLALQRRVPAMMTESARARLVEALAKAGDVQGARAARQRYDTSYPNGAHRDEVAEWAP